MPNSNQNLVRRGAIYHFRRRLPSPLKEIPSRSHFDGSLQTTDPARARRLARKVSVGLDQLSERLQGMPEALRPTPGQLNLVVKELFYAVIRDGERRRELIGEGFNWLPAGNREAIMKDEADEETWQTYQDYRRRGIFDEDLPEQKAWLWREWAANNVLDHIDPLLQDALAAANVDLALQELERQLGFELFHRTRQRLVPTAEAHLYFQEVEESFASLSRLRSAAARIRDFGSGEIHIATLSALSTNIVPRALRRFRDRHPQVSITLQVRMSATVKDLILSGRFDIGLAADEIDVTGIDAKPFAEFPAALLMPEGHPLCARERITPSDLHECPFIALSPEDTTRQALDRLLAAHGSTPRIVLETPFANTICAMVQAGLGCGIVNPLTAEPFMGRGVALRPFTPAVRFRTLLLRPADQPASRVVRDCMAALAEEIKVSAQTGAA